MVLCFVFCFFAEARERAEAEGCGRSQFREANTAIKQRDVSQMATVHIDATLFLLRFLAVLDTCSIFFHRRGDPMASMASGCSALCSTWLFDGLR